MDRTYWRKQTTIKPLFPDLLWSRPENKQSAGKLLIIGGNSQALRAPAQAYRSAEAARIGSLRVLLPSAVKTSVKGLLEYVEFGTSTPSGSFAQASLSEWLEQAAWANGVLLAGDLGHNSETTIVLEKFLTKYPGQVTLVGDTLDLALSTPDLVWHRRDTLLVPTFSQLQKLLTAGGSEHAVTSTMDFLQLVDVLHQITKERSASILLHHGKQVLVAVNGHVSSTHIETNNNLETVAAQSCVWWLQNPRNTFEALSACVIAE